MTGTAFTPYGLPEWLAWLLLVAAFIAPSALVFWITKRWL